jgi:hypothetical protein
VSLQCESLLRATREQQRIAALQPDHALASACECDQPLIDFVLRRALFAVALTYWLNIGASTVFEQSRMSQCIHQHHIRFGQNLAPAHRDQARIAWAGADQPDFAESHGASYPNRCGFANVRAGRALGRGALGAACHRRAAMVRCAGCDRTPGRVST